MKGSNKPRIAIWTPGGIGGGYFSQGIPVLSSVVNRLAEEYDVTVFSLHPANADFTPEDYKLISLDTSIRYSTWRWSWLILTFLKHHLRNPFTLLYAFWGFPAGFIIVFLGKLLKIRSIVHLQGGDVVFLRTIKYGILRNLLIKKLVGWTYKRATRIIALTHFQASFLKQMGVTRKVNVIPFGINLKRFPYSQWKYDGQRELRCLHVANHHPVKDQLTLIKSFAVLSKNTNAKLKIVGENSSNGTLKAYCELYSVSNNVELFETIPNTRLTEFFLWADVLILTSLYEGQGVVLVEGAASGTLLAGTSVGLLDDLGEAYAVTVKPGDCQGLAEKIEQVVKDDEEVTRRVTNAFRWAKEHDHDWTIARLKELFENGG
jgi:glycosyltransferase involved in cell wall biosynthesis